MLLLAFQTPDVTQCYKSVEEEHDSVTWICQISLYCSVFPMRTLN